MVDAVLFDPTTRKFSYTSAMKVPSEAYTSVVLQDGRVFFSGVGTFSRQESGACTGIVRPKERQVRGLNFDSRTQNVGTHAGFAE